MCPIRSFYPFKIIVAIALVVGGCGALAAGLLACSSLKDNDRVDAGFGGLDAPAGCGADCEAGDDRGDAGDDRGDAPMKGEQRDAPDEADGAPATCEPSCESEGAFSCA